MSRAGSLALGISVEIDDANTGSPDTVPSAEEQVISEAEQPAWVPPSEVFEGITRPQRESDLTVREQHVIALGTKGLNNKEVGAALGLSSLTVKSHLRRIGEKLGQGDRTANVSDLYEISGRIPKDLKDKFGLSEREVDVIELAAQGLSNARIGTRLVLSENTIKTHIARTVDKVKAKNRTHLVALAYGVVEAAESSSAETETTNKQE